ncbi:MAG TPA: condensation domain-containing protein, partial [Casimicrobiaceae bacterium]|nr:condensation domain-containing protein [Casimicrobiaceae bacterium]
MSPLAERSHAPSQLSSTASATDADATFPVSFAQQRMWLLDRLLPAGDVYNTRHVVRLSGALDVDALRRALAALVARHETLRTRFALV